MWLLSKTDPTLDKALEQAQSMEAAAKKAKELLQGTHCHNSVVLNMSSSSSRQGSAKPCVNMSSSSSRQGSAKPCVNMSSSSSRQGSAKPCVNMSRSSSRQGSAKPCSRCAAKKPLNATNVVRWGTLHLYADLMLAACY